MPAGSDAWRLCDDAGAVLGEGPVWHAAEQTLYWVDIKGKRLHCFRPADGTARHWDMHDRLAWVVPREGGGFVAGFAHEIGILQLAPQVSFAPRLCPEPDLPGNRLNDAKSDATGSIWFGSMDDGEAAPSGHFYRLQADFSATRVDSGYIIANGPAIAPDGRHLYHTDSATRTIYRYAIAADGTLSRRAPFIRFADEHGYPDGMTVDAQGGLWVAHWGGGRVSRFLPDGVFDRSIALPVSQVTSCCFGGADLDRLYVTSAAIGLRPEQLAREPLAGALFELTPGSSGLPCPVFAG